MICPSPISRSYTALLVSWMLFACGHDTNGLPEKPYYVVSLSSVNSENRKEDTKASEIGEDTKNGGQKAMMGGGIGSQCKSDKDCKVGFCALNFPEGYCTISCESSCPDNGYCGLSSSGKYCYAVCKNDEDCRSGYICVKSNKPHCIPKGQKSYGNKCLHGAECNSGVCLFEYCGEELCQFGYCSESCKNNGQCKDGLLCVEANEGLFCVKKNPH